MLFNPSPRGVPGFTDRTMLTLLRRHWVPAERRAPDCPLDLVFADKVERNEVFCELEILLHIDLNDQELAHLATLGELMAYVNRQRGSASSINHS